MRTKNKKNNHKNVPVFISMLFSRFIFFPIPFIFILENKIFFFPLRSWQQLLRSASAASTAQVCSYRGDNRNLVTVMIERCSAITAIVAALLLLFVFAIQYRHRRKIKCCLTLAAACLKEWSGKQRHCRTVDARRSPSDVQICRVGPAVGFGVSRFFSLHFSRTWRLSWGNWTVLVFFVFVFCFFAVSKTFHLPSEKL